MVLQRFVHVIPRGIRRRSSLPSSALPSPVKNVQRGFKRHPPKAKSTVSPADSEDSLISCDENKHIRYSWSVPSGRPPLENSQRSIDIPPTVSSEQGDLRHRLQKMLSVLQANQGILTKTGDAARTISIRASPIKEAQISKAMAHFGVVQHLTSKVKHPQEHLFFVQFETLSEAKLAVMTYTDESFRKDLGIESLIDSNIIELAYAIPPAGKGPTSWVELTIGSTAVDRISTVEWHVTQPQEPILRQPRAIVVAKMLLATMKVLGKPRTASMVDRKSVFDIRSIPIVFYCISIFKHPY
ncbi:hypothetical protein C8J56DRAFT_970806 [Mycena floridula]|nr:hypothetical protein C8J56DRAFT_970806 [Mycena floridula]